MQSGHFARQTDRVKYHAFLPPPNNLEISVYRVDGLQDPEIWSIGECFVSMAGRSIKARGDLQASDVNNVDLEVIPDTEPHPRHANIKEWPEDRSKRILKAKKLAEKAKLNTPT